MSDLMPPGETQESSRLFELAVEVVADDAYLKAIGTAVYCFAILEWSAIYCGEKLKSGYIRRVRKKTAGCIAKPRMLLGLRQL